MKQKIIVVLGPTCTGKTTLAIRLAEIYDGEVISADSMQVYRDLDIGTAKPDRTERHGIPHHLIDIFDCTRIYSAGMFSEKAEKIIGEVHARKRLPVIAGGTGLYLRSLLYGLFPSPSRNDSFRAKIRVAAARGGIESLHRELRGIDPDAAAEIGERDLPRIMRALELFYLTGKTKSAHIKEGGFNEERYDALKIGLTMPRSLLYECINQRVDRMMAQGLADEVKDLLDKGVPSDCHALKALGYRQIVRHFTGGQTLEETVRLIKRDTRRFAKRQLTWFSREKEVMWFTVQAPGRIPLKEILVRMNGFLGKSSPSSKNREME